MSNEYQGPIKMSPIKTTTITADMWPYLTEESKDIIVREYGNTVHEFTVPNTGRFYHEKLESTIRRASLVQFGGITIEMKYGERNIEEMDKVASLHLAQWMNKLVHEGLIYDKVMREPFKFDLSLVEENSYGIYSFSKQEDGTFRKVSLGNGQLKLVYKSTQEELTESEKEELLSYDKVYTEDHIQDVPYRVSYLLWVFPNKKFNYLAAATSPYLEEYYDGKEFPTMYEDYNRYLGADLFVREGELPKIVIQLGSLSNVE